MLLSFVEEQKFTHLGCFSYSREEGTVAGRMDDQVDEDVKRERLDQVMQKQREISAQALQDYVGKVVPVLVQGQSTETELLWQGRLSTQAPEVDGVVYINDGEPKAGEIQFVEITESHDYDLVGHIVEMH